MKGRKIDDEKLRLLWPTRLPDKHIAHVMGHRRPVLNRRARTIGLKPRRLIWLEEGLKELAEIEKKLQSRNQDGEPPNA